MAFQKTIQLASGATGSYIRIGAYRVDRFAGEASFVFQLYGSAAAAAAAPHAPLKEVFAKLRLEGEKFNQYLSTPALAALDADDPVRAAAYLAARSEAVICDCAPGPGQATVFSDALDA